NMPQRIEPGAGFAAPQNLLVSLTLPEPAGVKGHEKTSKWQKVRRNQSIDKVKEGLPEKGGKVRQAVKGKSRRNSDNESGKSQHQGSQSPAPTFFVDQVRNRYFQHGDGRRHGGE